MNIDWAGDFVMILQVILLDLSLGGDNSIVIGMAAKGLPIHHQKRAIMLGAAGAIVARFILAAIIVWLLAIPYLKTIGGVVLIYIGMKLIGQSDSAEEEDVHIEAKDSFWGAIRTIVMADVIMSLDNVLAIVAATNEHLGLLVLGMLISVPIIIAGSTIIVKVMDRFPWIIYIGSLVIGWAAGGMIATDSHVGLPEDIALELKIFVTLVVGWGGFIWKHMKARKGPKQDRDQMKNI